MRSWVIEYRSKCGCTALKEPVDCGQGFRVYSFHKTLTPEQESLISEIAEFREYGGLKKHHLGAPELTEGIDRE